MARHTQHNDRKRGRTLVAASFALAGLAVTGAGVYAGLNATATNTTAQAVDSGTLKLTMANNGAGFGQAVTNLAPGDTVNRYVDLSNTGTLAAQNLTLRVADTVDSKLTTDATNGLKVTVNRCVNSATSINAAWNPTTGACAGTDSTGTTAVAGTVVALATAVPLATLQGATVTTLVSGDVGTAPYKLQMSLVLPDQNETTVNGDLAAITNTIQGKTASLTWTFDEQQRAVNTLNS